MALAEAVVALNPKFQAKCIKATKIHNLFIQNNGSSRSLRLLPYSGEKYTTSTVNSNRVIPLRCLKSLNVNPSPPEALQLKRKDFPPDFIFGASTSALQTEGAGSEGGRGPSTWDGFIDDKKGDKDVATDSYNKYKEDVQLLKELGVNAYRFSVAWPRILPKGTIKGGINQEGLDFYNNFINELIKNGITPFVTLFHFDLPQVLQDEYGGFLNRRIVEDFKNYADLCFKTFGDRVKYWSTINEPQVWGQFGYKIGMKNPKADPVKDPYLATHHIILAHSTAAKLYKEQYQPTQRGEIGLSLASQWFEPHSQSRDDVQAALRAAEFSLGWYMDPLVFGDYPFLMKSLVRDALPKFTEEEKKLVKGAFDFIGINYYTSRFASAVPIDASDSHKDHLGFQYVNLKVENKNGVPIGKKAQGSEEIYIYPPGLKNMLVHIHKEYGGPKLIVTENGVPSKLEDSHSLGQSLKDDFRIEHMLGHLYAVKEAAKQGVNVKGYFHWALLDNMEMPHGYVIRFGLYYVDYDNRFGYGKHFRWCKKSGKWYSDFLKGA